MKCAGVVVLYNPDKTILKNIETYIDDLDVLYIIDNTPKKNNNEMFKNINKIKYISNNDNLGIATALNIGAKKAISDNYKWLLTMDQDSKFQKGDVAKMLNYIISLNKNEMIKDISGFDIKKLAILSPYHVTVNKQTESIEKKGFEKSLVVMTSGNIINLSIYKKIGGFKDWFFIDAVDFDYCLNLKKHKYEIVTLNYIKLKHNLGDITKTNFLGKTIYNLNHNYIRRYYVVRNRLYLNKIYKKDFPWYCKAQLRLSVKEMIKVLLFEKEKLKKIRYMIKGYIDYFTGKSGKLMK